VSTLHPPSTMSICNHCHQPRSFSASHHKAILVSSITLTLAVIGTLVGILIKRPSRRVVSFSTMDQVSLFKQACIFTTNVYFLILPLLYHCQKGTLVWSKVELCTRIRGVRVAGPSEDSPPRPRAISKQNASFSVLQHFIIFKYIPSIESPSVSWDVVLL
jgi:hypothetical protein